MSLSYYRMVKRTDDDAEYLAVKAEDWPNRGPLQCGFAQVQSYKDGEPTYEELADALVKMVQAEARRPLPTGPLMYQSGSHNRMAFDALVRLGRMEYIDDTENWARLK